MSDPPVDTATSPDAVRQALTPEAVAKLGTMELRARAMVEGRFSGQHASPHHGASVEFVDHREYAPGDEPRHIDWKVYGRTDRLYVRRYEAETNLDLYLLLDISRSMDFASRVAQTTSPALRQAQGPERRRGAVTKLRYATFLAAGLGYIATRQRDAVGLFLFDHEVRQALPAMAKPVHLARLFELLEAAAPAEDTRITSALEEIAQRLPRRALVVLLSDLLDDPDAVLRSLGYFRHRGHDVIVLHTLDPAERSLDYRGTVAFEDLETGERLSVEVAGVRAGYLAELRRFLAAYRHGCRDRSLDYTLLDTSLPFDTALSSYLAYRRGVLGKRRVGGR